MSAIIIPSIAWLLGVILCLLLLWRHHQQKIEAGLITPGDLLNPSGIRWHLYAVPDDPDVFVLPRHPWHRVPCSRRCPQRFCFSGGTMSDPR
jgi:hypothetical protein